MGEGEVEGCFCTVHSSAKWSSKFFFIIKFRKPKHVGLSLDSL